MLKRLVLDHNSVPTALASRIVGRVVVHLPRHREDARPWLGEQLSARPRAAEARPKAVPPRW
eukprot:13882774-Alexandrium_andersonii.AAC.1